MTIHIFRSSRALVRDFLRVITTEKSSRLIGTIGGICGIIAAIYTGADTFVEKTEYFKEHAISASVVRSQETLDLDEDATFGTYVIFNNGGDYPEIITRITVELYTPFLLSSLHMASKTPLTLPLQVSEEISAPGDLRAKKFIEEAGYVHKGPSVLPPYIEPPKYDHVIAFGDPSGNNSPKYRHVLSGCNNSVVVSHQIPHNVVTVSSQFKLPNYLRKALKETYLLVESGVLDDTVLGLLNGTVTTSHYIGELIISAEFINENRMIDRAIINATNVYLEASKDDKFIKFSDWWSGYPNSQKHVVQLRKTQEFSGKDTKLKFVSAKDQDLQEYVISIGDITNNQSMPSFFENQDPALCDYVQVNISE